MAQNSPEQLLIPILRLVLQLVRQLLGSNQSPSGNPREDGLYGQWKDSSYQPPIPPEMPYVDPGMPYDDTGPSAGSDSSADSDGGNTQAEAEAAAAAQRRAQAQASRSKIDAKKESMVYVNGIGRIQINPNEVWLDIHEDPIMGPDGKALKRYKKTDGKDRYIQNPRPPGAINP